MQAPLATETSAARVGAQDEDEEEDLEALALQAEIKTIEMDCAIMDLRRDLEMQEALVADWSESSKALREGVLPHEWTDEEKREDRKMQGGLREAQEHVAELRERLHRLEAARPHAS
eukprot:CAMPEP_0177476952 /NCGR_PEP_ID=MMETSP0369-20130122/23869_1 /TAXON_ID=447022 ORGANISM="Scrippsiella hangoei-like, Strain SHHI-4" /NCGR_SAMPLE_ID=MMETSP0369 /ASSEMBLY_ACC=CAM_ASM_000364 /LENGTH=116 /DNA_ID=CAMNT_0018952233 /DNA_START=63 /DNA_END=410 /DNA_ORIENTATION=+